MPFLFAAAIDPSCPTLGDGARVDQLDRSGHYARWEDDFERARTLGVDALWYGPAYYRTHLAPDHHEWECAEGPLLRLRELNIEVIADLCRFGVPSWLGGFQDPAFPVLFAEFARAFARHFSWVRYFTPVSEILRCAVASALTGEWNECEHSDAAFVRALRNLCVAHELAVEAILAERPDAVIVHRESVVPAPQGAVEAAEGDRWESLRHLALDLTLGRELAPGAGAYLQRHGVPSNDLSFFRERRATGRRWLSLSDPAADGATRRKLAAYSIVRYGRPLFAAAGAQPGGRAVDALRSEGEAAHALRTGGAPLHGFAWTAFLDTVGWEQGASVAVNGVRNDGLCTQARKVTAAGEEYAAMAQRWRAARSGAAQPGAAQR
jgi:hypothetical protein